MKWIRSDGKIASLLDKTKSIVLTIARCEKKWWQFNELTRIAVAIESKRKLINHGNKKVNGIRSAIGHDSLGIAKMTNQSTIKLQPTKAKKKMIKWMKCNYIVGYTCFVAIICRRYVLRMTIILCVTDEQNMHPNSVQMLY